ncbi:hypothetical protein RRG08_002901 [Elysia crispata]|uniref:Apple domain-containing protein n=1 Tax=Elysia crispata TaxID=231223 RepID=A0AAE1APC5_9GAST|nr:hypothetical protein RRG08_002901 [Elysia crispata]
MTLLYDFFFFNGGAATVQTYLIWPKTYVATDIRDDILRPTDPESASGSVMRKFQATPNAKMMDSIVNVNHNGVSVTDCALLCLQENTFKCETFDYQFSLGTCRLSSVYPNKMSTGEQKVGINVYTRLYSSEYTKYEAVLVSAGADRTMSNTSSAEACAKQCSETTEFRCEAFEICSSAKTCSLHKTHIFSRTINNITGPANSNTIKKPDCTHYSRDHLYDYIRRDHQRITGHDEAQVEVADVSRCAYLCASGQVLPRCSSFETTQLQQGNTKCVFSKADPTNTSMKVAIEDTLPWALYTRANPLPIVNPTAHQGAGTHGPSTPKPDKNYCSEKSTGNNSETNIRIGIAFGTLILGALLGAAIMFAGARIMSRRYHNTEDLHGLSTWKR